MPRYDDRYGSTTRLYVGHLSSRTRTRDLEHTFGKYGRVRQVDMKRDYAFIDFSDPRDADDARHYLDGCDMDGHRIIVEFAKGVPRGSGGSRDYLGRGPPPGSGRCFNCGLEGHWARDCKAGDWKNKCYRCGERGHIEKKCPNSPQKLKRGRSYSRTPDRSRSPRYGRRHSRSYSPRHSYSRSRSRSPVARREVEYERRSPPSRSPARSRSRSPSEARSPRPSSKTQKHNSSPPAETSPPGGRGESPPPSKRARASPEDGGYDRSPPDGRRSLSPLSPGRGGGSGSGSAHRKYDESPPDANGRSRSPSQSPEYERRYAEDDDN